ncbi:MAG: SPW repeat protein [Gammaproteobacteria bacterium]|nr:SPW repeat protein [Gammaproteobacteria bacterium]MDH3857276.1 SPW repeat protein [Gammaproteobacteria bacterium]
MDNLAKHSWFSEHRRWEDICSALFGGLILLSPVVSDTSAMIAINAGLFGVLIVGLAMLELMSLQRWEEILELVCGGWIIASPFVLQYSGDLRIIHMIFGATVVLLALFELWQDRNRGMDS